MVYGALKFSEAKALVYGVLKLSEAKALVHGVLKFSEAKYKAGNPRISCLDFLGYTILFPAPYYRKQAK